MDVEYTRVNVHISCYSTGWWSFYDVWLIMIWIITVDTEIHHKKWKKITHKFPNPSYQGYLRHIFTLSLSLVLSHFLYFYLLEIFIWRFIVTNMRWWDFMWKIIPQRRSVVIQLNKYIYFGYFILMTKHKCFIQIKKKKPKVKKKKHENQWINFPTLRKFFLSLWQFFSSSKIIKENYNRLR